MTDSYAASLETLPSLVLDQVCEYLACSDTERRSLFAFSLTSKSCCAAAGRQRFERLLFNVKGKSQLLEDLRKCEEVLGIDGRKKYLRRLKVIGRMVPIVTNENAPYRVINDNDDDKSNINEHPFFTPPKGLLRYFDPASPSPTEQEKKRQNDSWLPFADFIAKLPALKDLVWESSDQIPLCILSILHESHPNSRLHVHTFSLRSLIMPRYSLHDIDSDEFALATSPCLYSIVGSFSSYESDGRVNYNEEAILEMIARSAPKLRHVQRRYTIPLTSLAYQEAVSQPRPKWPGFFAHRSDGLQNDSRSTGYLHSLSLDLSAFSYLEKLQACNRNFLSKLRILDLKAPLPLESAHTLLSMIRDGKFKDLQALSCSLPIHSLSDKTSDVEEATSGCWKHLPPMKELCLIGNGSETIPAAFLTYQGETLRKLNLYDHVISLQEIEQLQILCPNLRDVQLELRRTRGDDREVKLYRALGAFSRLENVSLSLICFDNVFPEHAEEPSDERKASFAREYLIDAAIDSHLANSIFRTISAANAKMHPKPTPSFECLKLDVIADTHFNTGMMDSQLQDLLNWVGRNWVCRRDPRDTHQDWTIVEEINMFRYEFLKVSLKKDLEESFFPGSIGRTYMRIWRELWPRKAEHWRDDWHSFPLKAEGD